MRLNELISELTSLLAEGVDGDTELLLYGEAEPGVAFSFDNLSVSINGDFVQLFMGVDE